MQKILVVTKCELLQRELMVEGVSTLCYEVTANNFWNGWYSGQKVEVVYDSEKPVKVGSQVAFEVSTFIPVKEDTVENDPQGS